MSGRKTITVYSGANASFILYEDDGETYAYEQGEYTRTLFEWNDSKQRLSIYRLQGNGKKIAVKQSEYDVHIIH